MPEQDPRLASRRYPRFKLDIRVRVVVVDDSRSEVIHARSTHIAAGGLGLMLTKELERGTIAVLEFTLPNEDEFRLRSELRYRSGFKCGFQFLEISREERARLRDYCNRLAVQ